MGKRGPKPKALIDTTWRPELAYVVGLLASDGCLYNDRRHINLTSSDVDQLETFLRILRIEHIHIGSKVGGYAGTPSHHVQFGSVVFYDWLVSIGLTARKSKTIAGLAVPDEYFADFFRGLFDGDGCIYSYWDTRWASSFMYYLEIVSASTTFLTWLRAMNARLYGVGGVVKRAGRGDTHTLRYAKRDSRVLLGHMYAQDNSPRLMRKFTKVENIRMIDATS